MKRLFLVLVVFMGSTVWATSYKLDPAHTEVGFAVTHLMISKVKGKFNQFQGGFVFDAKTGELKDVDVKIDAASIDTNNKDRDEHLKKDDFFNAGKFPEISFKSEKVELKEGKPVKLTGALTMRGVTKPVTMDIEYHGTITDPTGKEKVGFSASTKINRKDFGVSWNKSLDKGGLAVSEEVVISIDGEAVAQTAPAKK